MKNILALILFIGLSLRVFSQNYIGKSESQIKDLMSKNDIYLKAESIVIAVNYICFMRGVKIPMAKIEMRNH